MRKKSPLAEQAEDILRGKKVAPEKILKLAKHLKKENAFKYARRILARAREQSIEDHKLRLELAQQHALCTYKDPDLPAEERLEKAFAILQEGVHRQGETLQDTKDQETLGLAGAIFKRKWALDGQKQHLERSLAYYQRGYDVFEEGDTSDYGYTGINAAFVLDLLADQEQDEAKEAGSTSEQAEERLEKARDMRQHLADTLPALRDQPGNEWLNEQWWFLVTMAEAHFGLGCYEEARPWLQQAITLRDRLGPARVEAIKEAEARQDKAALLEAYARPHVPDWEYESTARQLAWLALLRENAPVAEMEGTEAWEVLKEFLDNNAAAVQAVVAGKVGLALSGGGFRASLFHIGMLAKLAELDMLRHVEVLSCVSGGSIIGAHYYLEVRKLLQEKSDSAITRQDYIDIVQQVTRDFLAGVQKNVRMRVAAELTTNLKMIFWPNYSRTLRVGELYEKHLFSRVSDGEGEKKRWLNDLFVRPIGANGQPIEDFNPKSDNWRRSNKVPILVLNATTLNTGHNWQFTASWMGEPPATIDTDIDGNYRLRRMYYDEAPERYQQMRLGHAVAASSCVPGLFEPLALDNLYERRTDRYETETDKRAVRPVVRLVDGGVHDNQGVMGLLEQDCTVLLVSDASGQMGVQDAPSRGLIGVPLRANSILMARVREAEYKDLKERLRASLLRGLMFVHLKKDLGVDPVDWVDTEDPYQTSKEARSAGPPRPLTYYGIRKEVQRHLAAVRTDLDSFADAEAYALMTSAYRMTEHDFAEAIQGFPKPSGQKGPPEWRFLDVEAPMKEKRGSKLLMKLLEASGGKAFKIWKLSLPLRILGIVLGLAALGGFFWASWQWASFPLITLGWVGTTVAVVLAGFVLAKLVGATLGKWVMRAVRYRETLSQIVLGVVMAVVGWLVARLHLHVFDKLYLRWGKVDRIVRRMKGD